MSKKTTNNDPRIERVKKMSDFKKTIQNASIDELKKIEQEVIKEADDVNKEVQETTFVLPDEDYVDVAVAIRGLLSKVKVQWQYAQAMVDMYDFWNPETKPKSVVYGLLDATLRQLGQMEFEGHAEWKAVTTVNAYFEPIKEQYIEVSTKIFDVADKHNTILEKLDAMEKMSKPLANNEEHQVPTQE